MQPVFLHDKSEIEDFLRQAPFLHLYALGDLDDFFWPYTTWIAVKENQAVVELILVYSGGGLPVVLAIGAGDRLLLQELLNTAASQPLLPRQFYAHFSPGLADGVGKAGYRLESHGRYLKMGLLQPDKLAEYAATHPSGPTIRRLTVDDEEPLRRMYDDSYPGNWFDPRMLETGCYFGAWQNDKVVSAAGIHVYSSQFQAAALGNICTRPELRGQGLGTAVTAQVCLDMIPRIKTIGLNVRADNLPALAAYQRLGFEEVAEYDEYMVSTS